DENLAEPDQPLREKQKKEDAKALFYIQSEVDDDILSRISAVNKTHEAWEILKQEYIGAQKVILVKLQTLRQKFGTLSMEHRETVQEYWINIMSKVLRSLSSRLEYVVPTIIESNDLSTYTFDEMMSFLMAHEDRLFQVKGESSEKGRSGYYG
ncbi:unnamed protein product, partial [Brassica rapa subsp. narinosa]